MSGHLYFVKAMAFAVAFVCCGPMWGQGPGPSGSAPGLYFYQGRHKVEVSLDAGTLAVETTAPVSRIAAAAAQGLARAGNTTSTQKAGNMLVATGGRSRAEMNRAAARIRRAAPGARVKAVVQRRDNESSMFVEGRVSFQLAPGKTLADVERMYGLTDVEAVRYSPRTYTAVVNTDVDLLAPIATANRMQESGDATWASPSVEQKLEPRLFNDPLLPNEWHLQNTGTNTTYGTAGNDLNVLPAWRLAPG
jgi:hypothetical protein